MTILNFKLLFLTVLFVLLGCNTSFANPHQCVDSNGKIFYTHLECPETNGKDSKTDIVPIDNTGKEANTAYFGQSISTNDQFSIRLPTGWHQIPNKVLEDYKRSVRLSSSDGKVTNYSYAFQKVDKKGNYFEYPYILIQVVNSHMSTGDIEKLVNSTLDTKEINDIKNKLPVQVSNINMGKYVYDSAWNIIWNKSELSVQGDKVITLYALKITKTKTICIYCNSFKNDFSIYSQLFEDFVRLINIDNPTVPYVVGKVFVSNGIYRAQWFGSKDIIPVDGEVENQDLIESDCNNGLYRTLAGSVSKDGKVIEEVKSIQPWTKPKPNTRAYNWYSYICNASKEIMEAR